MLLIHSIIWGIFQGLLLSCLPTSFQIVGPHKLKKLRVKKRSNYRIQNACGWNIWQWQYVLMPWSQIRIHHPPVISKIISNLTRLGHVCHYQVSQQFHCFIDWVVLRWEVPLEPSVRINNEQHSCSDRFYSLIL